MILGISMFLPWSVMAQGVTVGEIDKSMNADFTGSIYFAPDSVAQAER
jgi:hypothetical protein